MATLDTNIALGVRPMQIENPLAQYSQIAQIQNARNQNALAKFQLGAADREEKATNALNLAYQQAYDVNTGEIDLNKLRGSLSAGGYGSKLPAIEKSLAEMGKEKVLAQKAQADLLDAKLKQSRGFLDTIDPMNPNAPAQYIAWHEANHRDPVVGPALAARGITAAQSRAQIEEAIAKGPQAFADLINGSKLGTEKFIEMNRPTTQVIDQSGQKQILERPGLSTGPYTSVGTYADTPLPPAVLEQKKDIARSGASNITMSTEKKYGEQFAGKMADTDIAKLTTAEKAPQLAESANRIIDLVKQGNLFTGPVADVKLNIARALNVAGASNDEKIANTESLIAATGQSTLDAIKSAGLGTGQGFTDKDLKFLQGIAGGTITYTPQTLTELARLQHQAATRSAESWNTRAKQLPRSATEGTGLSTAPIKVPPLSPSAMFAKNPKTGERIQSLDGGNTWKPVGGK
jgi:hypothetical protein